MTAISRSILIEAPRKRVFEVISDFASYPKFLPEMEAAEIVRAGKKKIRAAFHVQLVRSARYVLDIELVPPRRISWELVESDLMKTNSGGWELDEIEPGVTEATYTMEMELDLWVPHSIVDGMVGAHLPTMLQAFKKRAEERPKKGSRIKNQGSRIKKKR